MLTMNYQLYLDKLHACWIGKNIGGTLGAPFEGDRRFLNIDGFTTKKGEPLPNDDLDLQLIWLAAMEELGPARLDANALSEYWLDWIPPHCNEYGIAKTNLRLGLLPPMSGEIDNEKWKTSNGAWIRSEIWAGLAPGIVDVAVKYAAADAMVDHGVSEGTYAEIFTASLQSAAYVYNDIRKLLEIGLSKIPTDSMVAKTVRLVEECYDNGIDYQEAREKVVEFTAELGWFQAPNNIGFVTIGLLYGEGDFRKSILYAVNCGDDTDCTAATVGATLGIIGGTNAIPQDWKDFVGDKIITLFINGMYSCRIPKTCTELTERIATLVPAIMNANNVPFSFVDGIGEISEENFAEHNNVLAVDLLNRSPYSYDITHYRAFNTRVELDKTPRVDYGDERKVTLTFFINPRIAETRKLQIKLILPEGWSVGRYDKTVALSYQQPVHGLFGEASTSFTVTVGERVEAVNRIYAEVTCPTMAYPVLIPIILIG